MTKKDLIKAIEKFDDYAVIVVSDGNGWCNIEEVVEQGGIITIVCEECPVFSDN